MGVNMRTWRAGAALVVMAALWLCPAPASGEVFTLQNGMMIEGRFDKLSSIAQDPLKGAGSTDVKLIVLVDDQLTRTFVPSKQIKAFDTRPPVALERIPLLGRRIAASGQTIQVVGRPIQIDPFDDAGYRRYSMFGPKGKPIDVVQGITEITPRWTKVEAIEGINHYVWTMKIATSSIPREQLSKILARTMDAKDPTQRLRIVRLYLQSERYRDARFELEQLLKEFPGLDELQKQVKELRQHEAQRLLKEVELRRDAGQYRLATLMLEQFPPEGVAGETLLKVREMLEDIHGAQEQGHKVLKLMAEHAAALKADSMREQAKGIIAEITSELNVNTLDRMAGYLRLADDPKMSAEQKMSLAISGWLLGTDDAVDSLAVSLSLVKVRDLVRQYLVTTRQPERDNILSQLTSEEGATNERIAALIAHMKPPIDIGLAPAAAADVANPAAVLGLPNEEAARPKEAKPTEPKPDAAKPEEPKSGCGAPEDDAALLKGVPAPAAKGKPAEPPVEKEPPKSDAAAAEAQGTGIPRLFEFKVPSNLVEAPFFKYWIQLPPEYDPYRRYPCIITLNGAATTPLQQIDWWAGGYSKDADTRYGQATRHGYIVIAPEWTREHQRDYEYSAREWAAVLYSLQHACKRFSIDTDRVYLTGHSMGGTAAWDMGIAHPSLWAGVIPIVAAPGKYISVAKRWENFEHVPMYFVCGEKDTAFYACTADFDRYLINPKTDVMVVQYLGRGHEPFFDEIQNLFTWMGLHKRDFFPKEFGVNSLRPWDNFFWWVETAEPFAIHTILPAEWGENEVSAKRPSPAEIKADPLAPNGVNVRTRGVGKITVWLSPEIVTFNDSLKVSINGKRFTKIQPRYDTLLEDVRTRGDRQHPFWAKVEKTEAK